jgi:hypothetical protein
MVECSQKYCLDVFCNGKMLMKKPPKLISDTASYRTFDSSLWKLAYFLGTTENLFTKQVGILTKEARSARKDIPQLEKKFSELIKKSDTCKLSKKEEKLFTKIDEKIYDYMDMDVFTPMEIKGFRQFNELIRIFGLIYLVAIFKGYLSDIVEEIIKIHPNMIKSMNQLRVMGTITQGNRKQTISYLTEKAARYLESAYFGDVIKYFKTNFKIDLSKSGVKPEKIIEIIASRNIHIHNKGIVNQRFSKNVKDNTLKMGTYKHITKEFLKDSIKNVDIILKFIDIEVKNKYLTKESST